MGLGDEVVRATLRNFKGVRRRFTKTGEWNGVAIIDDYGHHPVEIAAVLKAARTIVGGRVIAVVQPHRYTRLANLFDGFCTCFNDADQVVVADVYPAGELPIAGASRDALVRGLNAHGHRNALPLAKPEALAPLVRDWARAGGIVGVTVRLAGSFTGIETRADEVNAGAGALDRAVAFAAARARLGGLEFLSGIPGTIGGGFQTNAGAYGSEFKDVLTSADAVGRDGRIHRVGVAELGFAYRHSEIPAAWLV